MGAFLLVAAIAPIGCDRERTLIPAPSLPIPSLSAPNASAPSSPQEQALAAYSGLLSAYAEAGMTANPDEPKLAAFGAGQALATLRKGLTEYRDRGQIIKGKLGTSPRIADSSPSTDPTKITISDCINTADFLVYNAKSGALINDTPGGRRAVAAFVTEVGGAWKVTDLGFHEVGSC